MPYYKNKKARYAIMSKKILSFALVFVMVFVYAGCGKKEPISNTGQPSVSTSSVGEETKVENSSTILEQTSSATSVQTSQTSGTVNSTTQSHSPVQTTKVKVDKGTKGMEVGLNFGGKKFTMAIFATERYTSSAFTRVVKAFQTKFKCSISIEKISFEGYSKQVAAKKLSGKPFDITFMHGSFFPGNVIANLHEPLNGYITTADLFDPKNPAAGGIDYEKSSEFTWKGKIYGYTGYYGVNPYLMFYNKKMFRDAGITDPRTLYERGQWTWAKLKEIGKEVTDIEKNKFLGGYEFANKAF
ncbi:MAG TPA: hypothetical protein DEB10_12210, partial [Ruminococcaceae bacterium]|nr:hypothetical protein [Oscillospiraceae bacterium]